MEDPITYFLFKNSVILSFESADGVLRTEAISSDDPRFEKVVSLLKEKNFGDIPDIINCDVIKKLLRFNNDEPKKKD